jgi:hypothetical protein
MKGFDESKTVYHYYSSIKIQLIPFMFIYILIILDTTPPVVTFLQPPLYTNGVAVLKWTSNEKAVFHCSLDNSDFVDCGEGVTSRWLGSALEDGEHTLKVRATDDAGNIATPQPWTWKTGKEVAWNKMGSQVPGHFP